MMSASTLNKTVLALAFFAGAAWAQEGPPRPDDRTLGGPNGVPGELEQAEEIFEAFRRDNRKIYLRPDNITPPSLNGWLTPIFDPGPGKLDANGEATGGLDFSKLPSIGLPIWIAVLVLDPNAPNGIAYIPDTYVFLTP